MFDSLILAHVKRARHSQWKFASHEKSNEVAKGTKAVLISIYCSVIYIVCVLLLFLGKICLLRIEDAIKLTRYYRPKFP